VRVGIDVGGTFTDVLLVDQIGRRWHVKVRSTPDDPSRGVLEGLREALNKASVRPDQVAYVLHGTTVATNAVLQRRGATISLVVTGGFEDVLEIGRQQRPSLYDLFVDRIPPLVPRERRYGVNERIAADGSILVPLAEKEAYEVAREAGHGVQGVAVCLLFAYANPTHEDLLGKELDAFDAETPVSCSSRVLPEFREYERMSTTVIDAYVAPILAVYLRHLEEALRAAGVTAPLLLMQSHGGVLQSSLARHQSVRLLFSGLAAGALGGCHTGNVLGESNLITFDMGGTSTDVAVITNGEIHETSEGHIGGLPCRVPMVDVETVGAGGGSIAWVDEGGALHVGPQSAGADPGPCCYDMGGSDPTVTDANLLLGRLNPDYFLGGKIHLNPAPAREQIQALAHRLNLSEQECAIGIIRIVSANMERAIRVVSIERGFDPRDFALVAFGGAGPMHAWALAKDLGIPRVIVPFAPGLHSALGLLATPLRCDRSQTILQSAAQPNLGRILSTFTSLQAQVEKLLSGQGVEGRRIAVQRLADLRYEGQAFELTVRTPGGKVDAHWLNRLVADFHKSHQRRYGYSAPDATVTIVNLRVVGTGPMPPLTPIEFPPHEAKLPQPKSSRPVFFEETADFIETAIYDRMALGRQSEVAGPAIIEQPDSTIVIHPNVKAVMRAGANLVLEGMQ
jgi:N-methylhydantoinase A